MTKFVKLRDVTDPDAVAYVTDAFGEPMAAIYVRDLADWAWIIGRVDSWLQHASPAARDDCTEFMADRFGPCSPPGVDDLSWMVSAVATRLALVVHGARS